MSVRTVALVSLTCLLAQSLGCAGARRRQDRAVDAQLRADAVRLQRTGKRPVRLGEYELVKVERTQEAYDGEGEDFGVTINGNGREISQHRVTVTVRHATEGRTWTGRCRSRFQREGLQALDGVVASQTTQLAVSCMVDGDDALAWRFSADGAAGTNLDGRFARSDAGVGDGLRVELQLQGGDRVGRHIPMAHVRQGPQAVSAALFTYPERVWLTPAQDPEVAEASLALLLALRYLPYEPPKAERSDDEDDSPKGKGGKLIQIFS